MEQTRAFLVGLIKDLPFFDEFEESDARELSTFMSLRNVKEGTILFNEGDVGDYLFFIVDGAVEIILEKKGTENKVIASLTTGASVGEMSMIDEYERSATVRASTDMEILMLTKTKFDSILINAPHLGVKVLRGLAKNISTRLRSSQGRYRDIV